MPPGRDLAGDPPFVPTLLTLPSGRTAEVTAADTARDGTLTVPPDPARVGWWTGGARPGDPYGSTVIAGHIDSRRFGTGVLAELASAHAGQVVRVAGSGRSRSYRIVSARLVPKASLATGTAAFDQSGAARLVLITCGGAFDADSHSYADNVVIVAAPDD